MLLGILCLLFCQVIASTLAERLESTDLDEHSANFNDIPLEDSNNVSYKPVDLKISSITSKQALCLKLKDAKDALSAEVWAPTTAHLNVLKVSCAHMPRIWYGQRKYREYKKHDIVYENEDTAFIALDEVTGTFGIQLHSCNICLRKSETDPNYMTVTIASTNSGKIRRKRSINSITLSSTSEKKNVGDSLTVTCSAETSSITWKNSSGREVKTTSSSNPRVKEHFSKGKNESDLIFKDITLQHQGVYTCTSTVVGHLDMKTFNLTVVPPKVKPSIQLNPSKKSVDLEEGDAYSVVCSGNSPNITWKHSAGLTIPQYPGGLSYYYTASDLKSNMTSLIFKNATSWHSGTFICSVNHTGLEDSVKLTINVKPSRITFSPDDKDQVTVKENKDYDITCKGPLKYATWLLNGVEISTNKKDDVYQKDPELKNEKLQRKLKFDDLNKKDSGKYVCSGILAFNGSKIERTFSLKVEEDDSLDDPKLTIDDTKFEDTNVYLRVNETFEITCKGNTESIQWKGPPPYSWQIPESSSSDAPIRAERVKKKKVALKFKKASVSEEGAYTCVVSKRTKTKEKRVMVKIIDPAYFISISNSPTAEEMGNITLECKTGGHPKPMVEWYFNTIQPDGRSSTILIDGRNNLRYKFDGDNLLINNITYKEAGKYMCKAKQDIEKGITIQRVVDVDVHHKPYPVKNHTIVERKLNTLVTLICKMISNPAPIGYSWYKRNETTSQYTLLAPPSPSSEFKIIFDHMSKFGEYKCQATNIIGYNEQFILVIPIEPPRPPEISVNDIFNVSVHFTAKQVRNSSFTYYNVEYKEKDTRDWSDLNVTLGETWDTKYEVTNLQPKTTYVMRVRSINELGISGPSNEIEFITSTAIGLTSSLLVILLTLKVIFVARMLG